MEQQLKEDLSAFGAPVKQYTREIEKVESFLKGNHFLVGLTDRTFWNHILTLLRRVDQNDQNEMPFDTEDIGLEERTIHITEDFKKYMAKDRPFCLTDFETKLLQVYFQKMKEEQNEQKTSCSSGSPIR